MRQVDQIVQDIGAFTPSDDSWLGLEILLEELFTSDKTEAGIDALLGVFERFPEADGYGVFFSIVHGLESIDGYEPHLLASVRRKPTEFNTRMVNRLLNAGVRSVGSTDLLVLLEAVATDSKTPVGVALAVREIIESHRGGAA